MSYIRTTAPLDDVSLVVLHRRVNVEGAASTARTLNVTPRTLARAMGGEGLHKAVRVRIIARLGSQRVELGKVADEADTLRRVTRLLEEVTALLRTVRGASA